MPQPINVLLVEDDPKDAELIVHQLREAGFEPNWRRVDTEADFIKHLNGALDLVLWDYHMPQLPGRRALDLLKQSRLEIPFILISGTVSDDIAVEAMKHGATDYLLKDRLARLGHAVRQALEQGRLRQERLKAEAALHASEERYRLLFENNPLAMWLYDLESLKFLAVNESAVEQYGYTRGEFLGMTLAQIHPVEDIPALEKSLKTGATETKKLSEWRHMKKDGDIVHVEVSARPMVLNGRKVRLVLAADITEKKQFEAQFYRAQRLESIGTLASGIAHDLNNILAPIMMAAPLIRQSKSATDTEKMLVTVESSAQRAAKLVRQLLLFGRGVEGEKERLLPATIINEMLTISQQTFPKNITISTEVADDLAPILADATQVHQVLLNLCVNARDAMPQGGTLKIAAENAHFSSAAAAVTPGAKTGDYVLLKVTDTGIGMTPEVVDKIFTPFFTTKEIGSGTGLGLATVLGLARSHGGFVTLSSEPGKGSSFRVYFPAAPKSETLAPLTQTVAPVPGHGELLMVVDDEENVRDAVRGILIQYGYTVVVAGDGIEGISRFATANNEIELVITDLDMPKLGGIAMLRILKQMNPKLKVIVSSGIMSGIKAGSRAQELASIGIADYLDKPFTADQVLRAVHNAMAS
jgi:PAS domain S-box-containing protein